MYELVFLTGARAGEVVPVNKNLIGGRSPDCSLEVPDPNASRQHCRFVFDGHSVTAIDNNSSNGTYHNDVRMTVPIKLAPDDVIRIGETRIRRGAKFDNLIQIGHNVEIGEDTVVAALAGFSGGTTIGRRCIIAGQIGTNQHITVGDGAIITARTGVTKSVEPGRLMGGMMPAMDYQEWRKSQVLYARLPELFDRLKKLEKQVGARGEAV